MPVNTFGASPLQVRWAIVMLLVAQILTCTICIYTSFYLQHKWCSLLYTVEAPNIPRTTDAGKQIRSQIHEFRTHTLGCGENEVSR